tara:strand:- start:1512 stop:2060 length:549 start_codon:yes stop_codon:yes gene_type:complete
MYKQFNQIYHFIDEFKETDLSKLDSKISIIYRNYKTKIDITLVKRIRHFCKKENRKFYLANNVGLAYKLNLDGAYIPSFNSSTKHIRCNRRLGFSIIGSAHNIKQIIVKQKQKAEYIFISPLFKTKKNKDFLGLYKFLKLKQFSQTKIIPLGGINKKNIKTLNLLECTGFAAISFIKKIYGK